MIAASGTITQVIPPSLVLIVLADQIGVSVGDMYLGAIGPSVLQVGLFTLFILAVSILQPHRMPALPAEARTLRGWALVSKVLWGMVPSLVLIFLVLGTIFMGLATPTEAGAMGAVGAIVLAMLHGRYSHRMMWEAMMSTMRITAMVVFILIGATVFSLVFQGVNGGRWIEHILSDLPGGRDRLPDLRQHLRLLPRLLPRLLRDRLHRGADAGAGGARRSTSTWSGSGCCSA